MEVCVFRKQLSVTKRTVAGFEPAIPESERPQTHALDRTSTEIGANYY
jgi:hypothetical protein